MKAPLDLLINNPVSTPISCRMAADYKLELIYKKDFHEVFLEHQKDPEFGPLMVRMKVKDANGESAMDEAQWEAASVSPLNLFFYMLSR